MEQPRITSLLAEASASYNAGDYARALTLWRQVEQMDPGNEKAQEGIRMASLLLEGDGVSADPRVQAGIRRVRDLIDAGQVDEAREGCALLERLAPGHPDLASLRDLCGAAPSEGAGTVESLLEEAREALAFGREDEAARAATRALELEPGNMEACGILSLTAVDRSVGEPPADLPSQDDEEIDDVTRRQPAPGPPPVAATPPSAAAQGSSTARTAVPPAAARPAAEPVPPAGPPSASGAPPRIAALLAEGQVAFDQGRPQEAISTWSRIFVIDHSHAEASRRIDMAKAAIEEHAREVDDLFYKAVDAQEAGRLEEALGFYRQVLQANPDHIDARNSIQELTARIAEGGPSISLNHDAAREVAEAAARKAEAIHEPPMESVPLAFEPAGRSERPAPSVRMRPVAPPPLPARRGIGRPIAMTGGILVFAAAGVGAWLWLGNSGGSMPEAQATVSVPRPAAAPRPVANPVQSPGNAPIQVVPGSSPAASPPAVTPAPPAVEGNPADFRDVLAKAHRLHREKRWAEAVLAYREALRLNPVDFDSQDQLDEAMVELEKQARWEKDMDSGTRLFAEADYAGALKTFYRMQMDHPEIKMIETYIRNSWFNWGVLLLQAGDADQAAEKFQEVLELNPRDVISSRAREVARRYHGRPRDTVLETYAGTLTPRAMNAR